MLTFSTTVAFVLYQIANHQGYVKINWARLEKDVKKYGKRIEKETNNALPAMVQSVSIYPNHVSRKILLN